MQTYRCINEAGTVEEAEELRRIFINQFYMISDQGLKTILEIGGIVPAISREDKLKQIGSRFGLSWPESTNS